MSPAPDPARSPSPPAVASHPLKLDIAAGVGLAVVGGLVHAAGSGVGGYGYAAMLVVGGPLDYEYQRYPRSCCIELGFITPGFLAIATGGLMLGYGADYASSGRWTVADAQSSIRSSRRGLLISGALLGTTVALYTVSAVLYASAWSHLIAHGSGGYQVSATGNRLLGAGGFMMLATLLLAFPTGISTGVYLNRYQRDRFLLRRGASGSGPTPIGAVFVPALSREMYGLSVAGRF